MQLEEQAMFGQYVLQSLNQSPVETARPSERHRYKLPSVVPAMTNVQRLRSTDNACAASDLCDDS